VKKLSFYGLGGKLLRRERGQALPEYALMLGLLLSLLFIIQAVGIKANQMFGWVVNAFR
jgi:hypothetical protein